MITLHTSTVAPTIERGLSAMEAILGRSGAVAAARASA